MSNLEPLFPLYIVSKGRFEYMITSKYLTEMGIKHRIIVEPQEVEKYQQAIDSMGLLAEILTLDMKYKEKYELCDDLGLTKSTGSGPARNFAWDDSIKRGFSHHWVMDDNIQGFYRLNKNMKLRVKSKQFFRIMEDFTLRYENVSMSGPNYCMFAPHRQKQPPFTINTKLYSCNLIRNDVPFRWRGRYNEDVILSLDMLKAGWCTIQFNAFLQNKMPTQTLKGGNTDELYEGDNKEKGERYSRTGTNEKSLMLARVHPDVAKVTWRFNRVHHIVDYSQFKKKNKLIKRKDLEIEEKVNNYGLELKVLK